MSGLSRRQDRSAGLRSASGRRAWVMLKRMSGRNDLRAPQIYRRSDPYPYPKFRSVSDTDLLGQLLHEYARIREDPLTPVR